MIDFLLPDFIGKASYLVWITKNTKRSYFYFYNFHGTLLLKYFTQKGLTSNKQKNMFTFTEYRGNKKYPTHYWCR